VDPAHHDGTGGRVNPDRNDTGSDGFSMPVRSSRASSSSAAVGSMSLRRVRTTGVRRRSAWAWNASRKGVKLSYAPASGNVKTTQRNGNRFELSTHAAASAHSAGTRSASRDVPRNAPQPIAGTTGTSTPLSAHR
jgi:hypothetical protein